MSALSFENMTAAKFIALFRQFPKNEQLDIVKKLNELTFKESWELLDSELPDMDISEADIIKELKAVRYGDVEKA